MTYPFRDTYVIIDLKNSIHTLSVNHECTETRIHWSNRGMCTLGECERRWMNYCLGLIDLIDTRTNTYIPHRKSDDRATNILHEITEKNTKFISCFLLLIIFYQAPWGLAMCVNALIIIRSYYYDWFNDDTRKYKNLNSLIWRTSSMWTIQYPLDSIWETIIRITMG